MFSLCYCRSERVRDTLLGTLFLVWSLTLILPLTQVLVLTSSYACESLCSLSLIMQPVVEPKTPLSTLNVVCVLEYWTPWKILLKICFVLVAQTLLTADGINWHVQKINIIHWTCWCFQGEKGEAGADDAKGDRGDIGLKGKEGPPGPPGLVGVRVSVSTTNSKFHSFPMKRQLLIHLPPCFIFLYQGHEGKPGKIGETGKAGEKVCQVNCSRLKYTFHSWMSSVSSLAREAEYVSVVLVVVNKQ